MPTNDISRRRSTTRLYAVVPLKSSESPLRCILNACDWTPDCTRRVEDIGGSRKQEQELGRKVAARHAETIALFTTHGSFVTRDCMEALTNDVGGVVALTSGRRGTYIQRTWDIGGLNTVSIVFVLLSVKA